MKPGEFGYDAAIPEAKNLRIIVAGLCQEILALAAKWDTYKKLFGSKATLVVLNTTAPQAFHIIEQSMLSDIVMSLSRLSDSATMRNKKQILENLTFDMLVKAVPATHPSIATSDLEDVKESAKKFIDDCGPIRDHRHKKYGHNDLLVATDPIKNPLPPLGPRIVQQLLKLAEDTLNHVSVIFGGTTWGFILAPVGDGTALINWLKQSREEAQQHFDALKAQL